MNKILVNQVLSIYHLFYLLNQILFYLLKEKIGFQFTKYYIEQTGVFLFF